MKRLTSILISLLALTVAWLWITGSDTAWYGQSWAADVWRYWGVPWTVVLIVSTAGYVVGKRLNVREPILAWGVGVGVIGLGAWILGLLGLLYGWLVAGLWTMIIVWGWQKGDFQASSIKYPFPLYIKLTDFMYLWKFNVVWIAVLGILWYIARTLPMTCYPAIGWDECNSHLALPTIYVWTHSVPFYGVWWVNFSTFPQLSEMLTTLQMLFTDTPGAVWSYAFLLATCYIVYRWTLDQISVKYGQFPALIAVLCFLSVPAVTMYSQQTLVDMQLTFFLTAGTWCLWRRDWSTGLMLLALACGTKYTGLVYMGLAVFIFGVDYVIKTRTLPRLSPVAMVVIAGALGVYLRNVAVFGNPFYPFGSDPAIGGVDVAAMLEPFRVRWSWDILYRLTLSNQSPWDAVARPSDLGWWFPVALVGGLLLFVRRKNETH